MIVVKLGGSVARNIPALIRSLRSIRKDILIVPGGWIFADLIRRLKIDDDRAHWMAILAMEQYGYYVSSFGVETIRPSNFDFEFSGLRILLPYELILKNDELPHSWEVTSDSITIWIASKLGVKEVIKLTDVDGIILNGRFVERIEAGKLIGIKTCLDSHAPKLMIERGVDVFICNGLVARRVKDYIAKGRAKGTLVMGR